jgi:hypothetical protein
MGNFLDVASDLLRSGKVTEKRESFERVFSVIGRLQAVHSKAQLDLTNIESIFTALELGRVIQVVPGLTRDEIPLTIAALKDLIVTTLQLRVKYPTRSHYVLAPQPYGVFGELVKHLMFDAAPKRTVSVITFNYDVGVDFGLKDAGLFADYALEPAQENPGRVQLLKLHGSLNWAVEQENKKIRPLPIREYLQRYSLQAPIAKGTEVEVPIGSHLQEYFSSQDKIAVEPEPVIVPPSWNKADYHQALSDVWAAAARNLSDAEYIYVMGYSLPDTDSFFRHLYALGSVGPKPLREFVVFDPEETSRVDDRFRKLLGPAATARYTYRRQTFGAAIDEVRGFFSPR